ncbi:hypothetical protein R3P38DRAFT_3357018 [Favolaschia claudopus]|uniref:BTB domain-containing protein n=1 Tax=Favolaschia claudopus TaxID=2862362 RepID=A0AAW0BDC4_9AGAR
MGKHPDLYFIDGTLTLMAGDGSETIYNVYRAPLMRHSSVFQGMLTLPTGPGTLPSLSPSASSVREALIKARAEGLEGTTEENPVVLPAQLKAAELDEFIVFLFLRGDNREVTVERACAILKVSHFFDVDCGIDYARHHLDNNSDFHPALRMSLGFAYNIREWVVGGFDELVGIPIQDLSPKDEALLGPDAYRALARAQARVLDSRLRLALKPPEPNHSNICMGHYSCKEEWTKMWTSTRCVLGDIIMRDFSGSRVLERLPGYPIGHMGPDCHRRTCEGLMGTDDKPSIFTREEELIDEELKGLMQLFGVA